VRGLDLGLLDYVSAWRVMKLLHREVASGSDDALMLVEHPHVITVGKHGRTNNVVKWELPVYVVERGGDATYHGPGQLVAYPVVKLRWPLSRYLWMLEEAVIRSLRPLGVEAGRVEKHRGVWVGGKKVASIGIAVEGGVAYHGVAVNVSADLSYFYHINPCGLHPSAITSLNQLGVEISVEEYKGLFVEAFEEVFETNVVWVDPAPYLAAAAQLRVSPTQLSASIEASP